MVKWPLVGGVRPPYVGKYMAIDLSNTMLVQTPDRPPYVHQLRNIVQGDTESPLSCYEGGHAARVLGQLARADSLSGG